ncbi:glucosaminidase domain-containing protein [Thalassospira australica]|uniref:glucosaminidase domain-containing protein n=1 Tax=Thalassospira australica TaxID=1528106 RepID=UPI00051A2792|nr:glucosaminidase domain-containing protein [Thalassospira australica]
MKSAETGNYRKIALGSIFAAIFFLYVGIFAGIDISPTPKGFGSDTVDVATATTSTTGTKKKKPIYRRGPEVVALNQYFKSINYLLDDVDEVPRVYIKRVPKGLGELESVDERKQLFLRIMLPLAMRMNEEITAQRERLMAIQAKGISGTPVSDADQQWVDQLVKRYRVTEGGITALLERIDVIPTSLVLAQSAEESGWGTSRFVRKGNALFGQWAWGDDEGIVPKGREEGKTHVIKAFDSLMGSVRAYARNINSHPAYQSLRERRASLRANGKVISGWELAETLTKYSERGAEYVDSLHAIMSVNGLNELDGLEFAAGDVPPPPKVLASIEE